MVKEAVAIVLAILSVAVSGKSIRFKPCGGSTHPPTTVELSPCDSPKGYCEFRHGQTVDVKVTFVAQRDEPSLKSAIHGILNIFGVMVPVNWPMPNSDGCRDQGLTCPIAQGQTYTYHNSFEVINQYPKIKLPVKWQLDSADGKFNHFCFMFPMAIIDDPPNSIIG